MCKRKKYSTKVLESNDNYTESTTKYIYDNRQNIAASSMLSQGIPLYMCSDRIRIVIYVAQKILRLALAKVANTFAHLYVYVICAKYHTTLSCILYTYVFWKSIQFAHGQALRWWQYENNKTDPASVVNENFRFLICIGFVLDTFILRIIYMYLCSLFWTTQSAFLYGFWWVTSTFEKVGNRMNIHRLKKNETTQIKRLNDVLLECMTPLMVESLVAAFIALVVV